jgi:hypothetical protein
MAMSFQSFTQRPKQIGTCARCSISAAAKSKKRMIISKLSDAELVQQLADQAKELGIEIDLN